VQATCYNADAMQHYSWPAIAVESLTPLATRQVIHCDTVTMARLSLKAGAVVRRHQHPNEQITTVESGWLRFAFDDATVDVRAGESLQIPGNAAHEVTAVEDSVALDVFCPVREDWIRGEDAYLRR
jgi:quercetin dioxygenase-like cupin family protein